MSLISKWNRLCKDVSTYLAFTLDLFPLKTLSSSQPICLKLFGKTLVFCLFFSYNCFFLLREEGDDEQMIVIYWHWPLLRLLVTFDTYDQFLIDFLPSSSDGLFSDKEDARLFLTDSLWLILLTRLFFDLKLCDLTASIHNRLSTRSKGFFYPEYIPKQNDDHDDFWTLFPHQPWYNGKGRRWQWHKQLSELLTLSAFLVPSVLSFLLALADFIDE